MGDFSEKRNHKRDLFTVTVEYTFSGYQVAGGGRETGAAVTSNLSTGGLCFYTNRTFDRGQRLTLSSRHLAQQPLKAEVRWCNMISENIYRVGLMFS